MNAPTTLDDPQAIDRLLDQVEREVAGKVEEAEVRACEARDAALRIGYRRGELAAATALAQVDFYRGRLDACDAALAANGTALAEYGHPADRLFAASLRGAVAMRRDPELAMAEFDALQGLAATVGPGVAQVVYLNRRGQCRDALGDLDGAMRCMFEALAVAESIEAPALIANMLSNLGSGQHDAGNIDDATDLLAEALALIDEHGLDSLRTVASCNLAMCHLANGEFDAAWDLLTRMIEQPIVGQDPEDYVFCRLLGAEALLMRGDLSLAERFVTQGLRIARQIDSPREIMHGELLCGQLCVERANTTEALAHLATAEALENTGAPELYRAQLHLQRSRALAQAEQWAGAYSELQRHHDMLAAMRTAARKTRLHFRAIAEDARRFRSERDDALRREAEALNTSRELDRLNRELSSRLREVEELRERLAEQSIKDHLTGIYNRRYFEQCFAQLIQKRTARFAVVLIDLDHFKQVNDGYGHAVGDTLLARFAKLLNDQVRGGDLVCRYGGEEFCLLLHRATAEQALMRSAAIAAAFSDVVIETPRGLLAQRTFSAGIAEYPRHGRSLESLLQKADLALYQVKESTRNAARIAN